MSPVWCVACLHFSLRTLLASKPDRSPIVIIALIAATLASSCGISIYVAFAFFLVMLMWSLWQIFFERTTKPALTLAGGGAGASLLLVPYLWEIVTRAVQNAGRRVVWIFRSRDILSPASSDMAAFRTYGRACIRVQH